MVLLLDVHTRSIKPSVMTRAVGFRSATLDAGGYLFFLRSLEAHHSLLLLVPSNLHLRDTATIGDVSRRGS